MSRGCVPLLLTFRHPGTIVRHHSVKTDAPFLPKAAAAAAAVTIVLYQAWLMPFFQPFFAGRVGLARMVFYALYASLLVPGAALFFTRPDLRRKLVPFALVAACSLAATTLHPVGLVTRGYIIAICMGSALIVLMLGSAPGAILRVVAAVASLNALLCLVDLLFADGFTTTPGRVAGLALNPNSAAASILLGAAASYRAVPKRLQLSFVIVALAGIGVTLSRSTSLAAAAAIAVPFVVILWQRRRRRERLVPTFEGAGLAAVVAMCLVAWIGVAATSNRRFIPAVRAATVDSLSFTEAIDQAHDSVAKTEAEELSAPASRAPASPATATATSERRPDAPSDSKSAATSSPESKPADTARITALGKRLADEGTRNTISARTLFLERAMLTYRRNGFFGMGLEDAHPLVPHNSFVLFALAYGHLGWLIPLALVGLTLYHAQDARDLPLAIAAVGTMATSHDILITPSLFVPIALGIGGLIGRRLTFEAPEFARSAMAGAVTGAALFVVGCVAIVRLSPMVSIDRLDPAFLVPYKGVYATRLPLQTFPGVFRPAIGLVSPGAGEFMRDGTETLARAPWKSGMNPVAPGAYAVRDSIVFFQTSDRSDPRTSRHAIEMGVPHEVSPTFYALMAALMVWCAGLLMWFGRDGVRGVAGDPQEAWS